MLILKQKDETIRMVFSESWRCELSLRTSERNEKQSLC